MDFVREFIRAHLWEGAGLLMMMTVFVAWELWEGAILGALLGVSIFLTAVRTSWNRWLCETQGESTAAQVLDFETVHHRSHHPGGSYTAHFLVVEYSTFALPSVFQIARIPVDDLPGLGMLVGKTIPIKYLPSKPELVILDNYESFLKAHGLGPEEWLED